MPIRPALLTLALPALILGAQGSAAKPIPWRFPETLLLLNPSRIGPEK